MKLLSYIDGSERRLGALTDAGVVDLTSRWPSVRAALETVSTSEIEAAAEGQTARPLDGIVFEPTVPDAEKIICVGMNYRPHVKEFGRTIPENPSLFVRFPSSQVGHEQSIIRPRVSDQYDFEGELAVVIGRRARHVKEEDALSYVGGYTCFGDHSVRDWQRHTNQATPGKNFHHSGAMGPWLVTADEIPDPADLTLTTRLNGQQMQNESVAELIFSVPFLIAYISTFAVLQPGDVITTGTPSGIGVARETPVFMKAGDRVEIEISRIGILANTVVDEER